MEGCEPQQTEKSVGLKSVRVHGWLRSQGIWMRFKVIIRIGQVRSTWRCNYVTSGTLNLLVEYIIVNA